MAVVGIVPVDGFEKIINSVLDGGDGEEISPPLLGDERKPRKGWCILATSSSQSTVSTSEEETEALEALDRIEKGHAQEDDYDTVRYAIRPVDRTTTIVWGLPRKAAAPAPTGTQKTSPPTEAKPAKDSPPPEAEPEAKPDPEPEADPTQDE